MSHFTSSAILSNSDLERRAPAIFASHAHSRTSDIYVQVPTIQVVDTLRDAGWQPVAAGQARVRDASRQGFQKHFVRLRQTGDNAKQFQVGDSVVEMLLINAHDGLCSYNFRAGVYRFVCANGLVVSDAELEAIRLRHVGFELDEAIAASQKVIDAVPAIAAKINAFQAVDLTENEQRSFANQALSARWEENAPIKAEQLLQLRRWDDRGSDLWSVTNRIQENLIRGGQRGRGSTGRRTTTREVKSIDADVSINQQVWDLANQIQIAKAA